MSDPFILEAVGILWIVPAAALSPYLSTGQMTPRHQCGAGADEFLNCMDLYDISRMNIYIFCAFCSYLVK